MRKKQRMQLIFGCLALVLVLVVLFSGVKILEATVLQPQPEQLQTQSKTVIRDGVAYYPRQDLTVVLVMGINRQGPVQPQPYNKGGAADMVALLVFDRQSQSYHVLNLNRDMMVDMPMLNQHGKEAGVYHGQLAYSHTYGDGMADSCRNVAKTVSNLLGGVAIDYYFSMSMDTIAMLNDAVGGVTVTVEDDFSQVDPQLPMGRVTLMGQQAVTFVQTRWNVGDQLNLSRMRRQQAYMEGFAQALDGTRESKEHFLLDAYQQVEPYIVTDCSLSVFSRLETDFGDYPLGRILTVEGENVLGEEYYEFYPDEEALEALVLELFYAPK